ncbi:MAG: hypothetical protein ACE5I1_03920 [bacterium]
MTRKDIHIEIKDKCPELDDKLIDHFITVLENAIKASRPDQANFYFTKAMQYGLKMGILDNEDDIINYYFDEDTNESEKK